MNYRINPDGTVVVLSNDKENKSFKTKLDDKFKTEEPTLDINDYDTHRIF